MSTGYTHEVGKGDIEDFSEFIKICGKAFVGDTGESLMKILQTKGEISEYRYESLKSAKESLKKLKSLSPEELGIEYHEDYNKRYHQGVEGQKKNDQLIKNYKKMLIKVRNWRPPEQLNALKRFMIEQLESSIEWDEIEFTKPKKLSPKEWLELNVESLERDIEYYEAAIEEEKKIIQESNEWKQTLLSEIKRLENE